MGPKITRVFQAIDSFNLKTGKIASFLAIAMMLIIVGNVITRYAFNIAFIWAFPINRQVFGVFILFAGVYAMLAGGHLRVEILYTRFSPRARFYARVIDLIVFVVFIGVLVWQGSWLADNSLANKELSQGTPKVPLYIIKTFIPVVSFLLLLQGISSFFRKEKAI